jgi:hypothetical protein
MPEPNAALKELMLADLVRIEEAVWRNEEIGGKRFDFFVTLVTAVVAGLVALWSTDRAKTQDFQASLTLLTGRATIAILIFGLVSHWRMVHRDKVTAEYKRTANTIRRTYRSIFRSGNSALSNYRLEFEIKNRSESFVRPWKRRLKRICQMGYTQTLAVLDGILLMVAVDWTVGPPYAASILLGVVLTVFLSIVGATPHNTHGSLRKGIETPE